MALARFLAIASISFAFIGTAVAGPINFSTTGYSVSGIGAEFQTDYDAFTVTGLSGSIDAGHASSGPVEIGTYSFTVGPNCYSCTLTPSGFTTSFNATIGTQTKTILLPWSWSSTGPVDTLSIGSSAPVTFDIGGEALSITGLGIGDLSSGGGTLSGEILADFDFRPIAAAFAATDVPEPCSVAILAAGLLGVGALAGRRRHRAAAAA